MQEELELDYFVSCYLYDEGRLTGGSLTSLLRPPPLEHKLVFHDNTIRAVGFNSACGVETMTFSVHIAALLQLPDTPFHFSVSVTGDCLHALHVYVEGDKVREQWVSMRTIVGEQVISMLLHDVVDNLFLRHSGKGLTPTKNGRRKRKHANMVVEWMAGREHVGPVRVNLPTSIVVPRASIFFSVVDMMFVEYVGEVSPLSCAMGLVIGERNTGKSEAVRDLVLRGAPPVVVSSSRRPSRATLLVVPPALVQQWTTWFPSTAVVLCVPDVKALRRCTAEQVEQATVVITTYKVFLRGYRIELADRIRCRVFAQTPTPEFELSWFSWPRVVVDELLLLYAEKVNARINNSYEASMWWGLQGGVSFSSAYLPVLMQALLPPQPVVTLFDLNCFSGCMIEAESEQGVPMWIDRTVFSELTPFEKKIHDTMVALGASEEDVRRACAGDLSFINRYMRPVQHWVDTIPLGVEALSFFFPESLSSSMTLVREEGEEEEEDEERGRGGRVIEVEVVVGGDDDDDDEDTGIEGNVFDVVAEHCAELSEKRSFFTKTALSLSRKEVLPAVCGVCLVNTCDCLFVCGHMLCRSCVIELFRSSEDLIAPCPTCRWKVEPAETMWVTGEPMRPGSRFSTLSRILKGQTRPVVVFGSTMDVLCELRRELLLTEGMSSKVFKNYYNKKKKTPLLFVPYYKTFGLKLYNFPTVVFLDTESAAIEAQAMQSVVHTEPLQVFRISTLFD